MVKVQFKSSNEIIVIKDATVVQKEMNIYNVTLPINGSVSREDFQGVKLWIDENPSLDAKVSNMSGNGGKTFVTLMVLL
ncbi:MAG: hypothetical protein AB1394_11040 [Bacteroidota bacterium]|jgi:hypothetical protein